jgi:hypothetical protein
MPPSGTVPLLVVLELLLVVLELLELLLVVLELLELLLVVLELLLLVVLELLELLLVVLELLLVVEELELVVVDEPPPVPPVPPMTLLEHAVTCMSPAAERATRASAKVRRMLRW